MSLLHAIILGIVEGITEFFPVSSTGHLILAGTLIGVPQTAFVKSFEIAIQLGAILAVVVLYGRSFVRVPVLTRLAAAFVPTGILGFLLYKIVKGYLLGNGTIVVWALGIGGIMFIAFELVYGSRPREGSVNLESVSYSAAATMGVAQAIAMVPGVSRSAATVVGGMMCGVSRAVALEFSFLLAVPTMLAATGYDLFKNAGVFVGADWSALVVGFVVSFVVALASIKWLMAFMRRHTFIPFGVYRIFAALAFYFAVIR